MLTAAWFVKRTRKASQADCERRIEEFERALLEGIEIGRDTPTQSE